MALTTLTDVSNQLADAVASAARSVVQVHGRRQPASGVVHGTDVVVTTTRAIGQEDGLSIRTPEGRDVHAELIGWDPATHLVALRAAGLDLPAVVDRRRAARRSHRGCDRPVLEQRADRQRRHRVCHWRTAADGPRPGDRRDHPDHRAHASRIRGRRIREYERGIGRHRHGGRDSRTRRGDSRRHRREDAGVTDQARPGEAPVRGRGRARRPVAGRASGPPPARRVACWSCA